MKDTGKTTKRAWSTQEDDRLRGLVEYYGASKWTVVAEHMGGRTGKQCRERWHNHLDPAVKKGEWTPEEDRIIIEMQLKLGNQWAKITKMLPGRTDNAVKNRWHSSMRNKNKAIREQAMAIPLPNHPTLHHLVRGQEPPSEVKSPRAAKAVRAKAARPAPLSPAASDGSEVGDASFAPRCPEVASPTPTRGRALKRRSRGAVELQAVLPQVAPAPMVPLPACMDQLLLAPLHAGPMSPLPGLGVAHWTPAPLQTGHASPKAGAGAGASSVCYRVGRSFFSNDYTTDESDEDDFAFMTLFDETETAMLKSPLPTPKPDAQLVAPAAWAAAAAHGEAASIQASRFPVPAMSIFPEPFEAPEHDDVAPRDPSPSDSLTAGLSDWLDECYFLDDPQNFVAPLAPRQAELPEDLVDFDFSGGEDPVDAAESPRKRRRLPSPSPFFFGEVPEQTLPPSHQAGSDDKHLQQQLARLHMTGFQHTNAMMNAFAKEACFPQQAFFPNVMGQ